MRAGVCTQGSTGYRRGTCQSSIAAHSSRLSSRVHSSGSSSYPFHLTRNCGDDTSHSLDSDVLITAASSVLAAMTTVTCDVCLDAARTSHVI